MLSASLTQLLLRTTFWGSSSVWGMHSGSSKQVTTKNVCVYVGIISDRAADPTACGILGPSTHDQQVLRQPFVL
jgi:hypothetical protein